jgi:hypothetical protein
MLLENKTMHQLRFRKMNSLISTFSARNTWAQQDSEEETF